MEINILESDKNGIEVQIGSVSMAEILRVYLNKDSSVSFVAWKREHPIDNPILKVQTKGKTPKKAINNAVSAIEKDLDNVLNDFKKLK